MSKLLVKYCWGYITIMPGLHLNSDTITSSSVVLTFLHSKELAAMLSTKHIDKTASNSKNNLAIRILYSYPTYLKLYSCDF